MTAHGVIVCKKTILGLLAITLLIAMGLPRVVAAQGGGAVCPCTAELTISGGAGCPCTITLGVGILKTGNCRLDEELNCLLGTTRQKCSWNGTIIAIGPGCPPGGWTSFGANCNSSVDHLELCPFLGQDTNFHIDCSNCN